MALIRWRGIGKHWAEDRGPFRRWLCFAAIPNNVDVWRSPRESYYVYPDTRSAEPACWWLWWSYSFDSIAIRLRPINPLTLAWLGLAVCWRAVERRALFPLARFLRRTGVCWTDPGARVSWWRFLDSVSLNQAIREERRMRRWR